MLRTCSYSVTTARQCEQSMQRGRERREQSSLSSCIRSPSALDADADQWIDEGNPNNPDQAAQTGRKSRERGLHMRNTGVKPTDKGVRSLATAGDASP